jgi:hypothetical protein
MHQQKAYVVRKILLFLTQAKHLFTEPQSVHAISQIEKLLQHLVIEAQK